MMRESLINRKTKETDIKINLNVNGGGRADIKTPIPFLNHLLDNFARHGLFDLKIEAKGDIEIDQHHTVEDLGIALGDAFKQALGDKKGINRAGYFVFPLDEALSIAAIDISGRAFLNFNCQFQTQKIGDLDGGLIKEFFWGVARHLEATLYLRTLSGENDHHKAESLFKAFGKAMKMACSQDPRIAEEIPSTKGVI